MALFYFSSSQREEEKIWRGLEEVKRQAAKIEDGRSRMLEKKLADKTLIQRAINRARKIVSEQCIYVVTDSEEICLVCKRNNVQYYYDKDLWFSSPHVIDNLGFILSQFSEEVPMIIRVRSIKV